MSVNICYLYRKKKKKKKKKNAEYHDSWQNLFHLWKPFKIA